MSNKKPKISSSQIVGGAKIQLLPDDPLTKILKTEHFDLLDPNSFQVDITDSTVTLTDKNPSDSQIPDEIVPEDPNVTPDVPEYPAPNIEDISVLSQTLKTDASVKQYWEFKFRVINKMGDRTIRAGGYVA